MNITGSVLILMKVNQITPTSDQSLPENSHVSEVVSVDCPADAAGGRLLLLDQLGSLGVRVLRLLVCELEYKQLLGCVIPSLGTVIQATLAQLRMKSLGVDRNINPE